MDITDYADFLERVNFNYQKEFNPQRWYAGHKDFEKAARLSFTSNNHRKMFLEMKKRKLTEE